jgi:hypothetical protein
MKTTTTTTTTAPARTTLKVRTAVRAGYSLGATQIGNVVGARPRSFGDVIISGDI